MERTYRFDGRCGLRKQQTKLVLRVLLLLLLQLLLLLLLVLFVCSVRYGSHAKAVNRRHRGTLCSVFVGRAVRVRVARSHAPESRTRRVFSLTARVCRKKNKYREHPRQHAAIADKAHEGVIDVASAPCPPSAARLCRQSRRHRVGMASSHGPSAMRACLLVAAVVRCACIRDGDVAGFLLMRCAHSPGTTRVLLTNSVIFPFQILNQTQSKHL